MASRRKSTKSKTTKIMGPPPPKRTRRGSTASTGSRPHSRRSSIAGTIAHEDGHSIGVYLRVRPSRHGPASSRCITVDPPSNTITVPATSAGPRIFVFDHVAPEDSTQADVFTKVGQPLCDSAIQGFNGTILAYGQTGAGKTHTLQGPAQAVSALSREARLRAKKKDISKLRNKELTLRGIMPRVFDYISGQFARLKRTSDGHTTFKVTVSYCEIYQERVYDLLDPQRTSLIVREDPKQGMYVDNLSEQAMNASSDAMDALLRGISNRRVGETAMNRESSRSHSVFSILIKSRHEAEAAAGSTASTPVKSTNKGRRAKGVVTERYSRFNIVDLAGSERQQLTGAAGVRLKEAGRINRSLSTLGIVIMSLVRAERTGKVQHVHYRDSTLTHLLKDSLGGNSLAYVVACVSPDADCFGDTLSTLKFVQRCKHIKNRAKAHEHKILNAQALATECARLKREVSAMKAIISANVGRKSLTCGTMPQDKVVAMRQLSPTLFDAEVSSPLVAAMPSDPVAEAAEAASAALSADDVQMMIRASAEREQAWEDENKKLSERIDMQMKLVKAHERQNDTRVLRIKLLEQQLADKEGSHDGESETLIALRKENAALKGEANSVSPALVAKQMELQQLKAQLEGMANKEPTHHAHHAMSRKVLTLNAELSAQKDRVTQMQVTLSRSPRDIWMSLPASDRSGFENEWKSKMEVQLRASHVTPLEQSLDKTDRARIAAVERVAALEAEAADMRSAMEESVATAEAMMLRHESDLAEWNRMHRDEIATIKKTYEGELETLRAEERKLGEAEQSRMTNEFADTRVKLELAQAELKGAHQRADAQEKSLMGLREKMGAEQRAGAALAAKLDRVRTVQAEAMKAKEEAEAALSTVAAERDAAVEARDVAWKAMTSAKESAQAAKSACEVLEKTRVELQAQTDSLDGEASALRLQLEKVNVAHEMMQEDHDALTETHTFQKTTIEELRESIAEKTTEMEQLKQSQGSAVERVVDLEAQLAELRDKKRGEEGAAESRISVLQDQVRHVKGELKEREASLREALTERSAANADIKQRMEKEVELTESINELRAAYQEAQAFNDRTAAEMDELRKSSDRAMNQAAERQAAVENATARAAAAEREREMIHDEMQLLRADLVESRENAANADAKAETLERRTEQLQKDFANATMRVEQLAAAHETAMVALKAQHEASIRRVREDEEQKRSTALREHGAQQDEVSALRRELEASSQEASERAASFKEVSQKLERALSAKNEELLAVKNQLQEGQGSLTAAKTARSEADLRVASLEVELAQVRTAHANEMLAQKHTMDEVVANADVCQTDYEQQTFEVARLTTEVSDLRKQLGESLQNQEDSLAECRKFKDAEAHMHNELEALRATHEADTERAERVAEELEAVRERAQALEDANNNLCGGSQRNIEELEKKVGALQNENTGLQRKLRSAQRRGKLKAGKDDKENDHANGAEETDEDVLNVQVKTMAEKLKALTVAMEKTLRPLIQPIESSALASPLPVVEKTTRTRGSRRALGDLTTNKRTRTTRRMTRSTARLESSAKAKTTVDAGTAVADVDAMLDMVKSVAARVRKQDRHIREQQMTIALAAREEQFAKEEKRVTDILDDPLATLATEVAFMANQTPHAFRHSLGKSKDAKDAAKTLTFV